MTLRMLRSNYGGISLADPKDTADFKYFTYINFPKFTSGHKSVMVHSLTKKIFDDLRHKITPKNFTFSNLIQAGVEAPSLTIGMAAGDEECYSVFKDLFYPVIRSWHGFDPHTETHHSDINPEKLDLRELNKLDPNKYILSSRVRAIRNISGFSLPAGSDEKQRKKVETVLKSVFKKFTGDLKGKYHSLADIDSDLAKKLRKEGVLFQDIDNKTVLFNSGGARDWPSARGVFFNNSHHVSCWVNEEDHCNIAALEDGANIKGAFEKFAKLSAKFKELVEAAGHSIMHHKALGFLSTCPVNIGTALRVSVKIKLPKLIAHRANLKKICAKYHLNVRGEDGDGIDATSNVLDISNKEMIGFTETELVQKVIDGITKIIHAEQSL